MLDNLDKIVLFRNLVSVRQDILRSPRCLHVLVVLRHLNRLKRGSNHVSVFILLHACKRQINKDNIYAYLKELTNAGYVSKISQQFRITESGLQALKELNDQLEAADYKRPEDRKIISSGKELKRPDKLF